MPLGVLISGPAGTEDALLAGGCCVGTSVGAGLKKRADGFFRCAAALHPLHETLDGDLFMAKEILCGFGVDVDAVAGWLGSYGGEDSPDDISRGLFAGEVGSPRLAETV
jgi:hypothetical protein